jgi:hypothetical protein
MTPHKNIIDIVINLPTIDLMKTNKIKLLLQIVLALVLTFIIHWLLMPISIGGGNMGEIFALFLGRHFLICIVSLFISDLAVFQMRRPISTTAIAAIIALLAAFFGVFAGAMLGLLVAALIGLLTGDYPAYLDRIGLFFGSVISMVFFYNCFINEMRQKKQQNKAKSD